MLLASLPESSRTRHHLRARSQRRVGGDRRSGAARPTSLAENAARYDGVVGVWYGKGPGLDRATDALRHANDVRRQSPGRNARFWWATIRPSKSSTVPAVSERSLAALGIPVLFPRNAREIVTMAMHGVAMSRASGCVVALKIVADVADGAWSVDDELADSTSSFPKSRWEGKPFVLPAAADGGARDSLRRRGRPLRAARRRGARLRRRQRTRRHRGRPTRARRSASRRPARRSTRCARRWATLGADDAALHRRAFALLRIGMPDPLGPARVTSVRRGARRDPRRRGQDGVRRGTGARNPLRRHRMRRGSSARGTQPGRPLIPAGGELTAGRLLGPLRRVLRDRLRVDEAGAAPPDAGIPVLRPGAPRTSVRAARTTARPRSPRAPWPAAGSGATRWSRCPPAPTAP